jgi:hypothetical protein
LLLLVDYPGSPPLLARETSPIAFVLGAILTAFYQWRRDLVANMFGHFPVDFAANVLPALFS